MHVGVIHPSAKERYTPLKSLTVPVERGIVKGRVEPVAFRCR